MSEPLDHEIEAIKCILEALTPLSTKARASVLDYVVKRLDMTAPLGSVVESKTDGASGRKAQDFSQQQGEVHIKNFKEQKKPRSANEMAALVAYYLANLAPESTSKTTINQKDVETYFKIAQFPLPQQIRMTLPNAKAAGYFDSTVEGEYKLNAVGHNLVVHSMPRGQAASGNVARPRKTAGRRKTKPLRSKRA